MSSAGPTVKDALYASMIFLGPSDRLSVPATSPVQDNQVIRVQRVRYGVQTAIVSVPYGTVAKPDPTKYVGQDTPVSAGKPGTKRVTFPSSTSTASWPARSSPRPPCSASRSTR